ncbi:MAG: hypothetical protein OER96_08110 [Gammaproteobacteria bacterium]|nr:hypothetical protein [Gammaproteobacteria bacterium]
MKYLNRTLIVFVLGAFAWFGWSAWIVHLELDAHLRIIRVVDTVMGF